MKIAPLIAALLAAGSASAATVWVAPAAQKIRPAVQPPAGAPASASIAAAQNEFESFHVVVTGAAAGVSMSLEGLSDGAGHTISGRDVVLYREALLYVASQTGGDGAAGMWPDALVPDVDPIVGEKRAAFPFDVPAGESRAVLVDIHAPQSAPAGTYTGVIHVTGGVTQDVPVSLTIWNFAVPSTSTLRSAFNLAWNGPCIGHGDGGCNGGASDLALRARYVQAALDNHISIHTPYYTSTVDSSGNQDWAAFDQYAGPFLDGTAPTRLPGAKLTSLTVNGPRAANAAQVAAWNAHVKAKGWTSTTLFDYVCDEPPLTCQWSDINPRISAARAGDPSVSTLVTTTTDQAKAQGLTGIDLFVPVINYVEGKPGSQYAGSQRARYGANAWWYQSCMSFGCSGVGGGLDGTGETGWPTMAVDSDGTRNRAMEWLSFSYDMQGELYYETTMAYFNGDPWLSQSAFGGTGDGTLFYPGTPAKIGGRTEIPVESLRMKGIRDGMEDYELLHLASTLGLGAQALQIAQGVYPKTYQATTSPAAIDSARAELAALILHALGKDVQAPAPTPTPSGTTDAPPATPPARTCDTTACASTDPAPAATPAPGQGLAGAGYPSGGCSSGGMQSLWLAIPFVLLFAMSARRRRRALAKVGRK
ncbi:MAG: glycoside hydrolase domain-containing protein [Myxococcales bacterium]